MIPTKLTTEHEELMGCLAYFHENGIQSEEDAETARELLVALKKCHNQMDAARKKTKKPFLDGGREVDSTFKPPLDDLDKGQADVKQKMAQWQQRVKAEQLKAAKAAELAAEAAMPLKKAAGAESMSNVRVGDFSMMDVPAAPDEPDFATRVTKRLVITDDDLIPREFMVPNYRAIEKAWKDGKAVPGTRMEERENIVAR